MPRSKPKRKTDAANARIELGIIPIPLAGEINPGDSIADKLVTTGRSPDGVEHEERFDRRAIVPYSYRHSYAQRHADEGVPPDVLRDLMGHDSMQTTMGYYNYRELHQMGALSQVA